MSSIVVVTWVLRTLDQQAPQLDEGTLNGLFDYDPYLGRVAPSSDVEPTPVGKEAETEEVELDK